MVKYLDEKIEVLLGWTYFHNLAGTEFPLKTMGEFTAIIRALNGSNDVVGFPNGMNRRYENKIGAALQIIRHYYYYNVCHVHIHRVAQYIIFQFLCYISAQLYGEFEMDI